MRMQMLGKHIQQINYLLQKASLNKVTELLGRPDNFIPPYGLVPKSYVCIWKQKMLGD
jgi:hypothetical protein